MPQTRREKVLKWILRLSWVLIVFGFLTFLTVFYWPEAATKQNANTVDNSQPVDKWAPDNGKLKVYGADEKTFTLWSRDEAIKFGLDNVANTIVYLWVAAAALLGLIGRFVIDPLLDRSKGRLIRSRTALLLVRHAAIGCLVSICFGFYSYLSFASIVTDEDFTIYSDLAVATLCQIITFVLAAALLMLAVNSVVMHHLTRKGNQR